MSREAGLRFKLSKKLKIASGRSENYKEENKRVEGPRNNDRKGKFKPMSFDRKKKRIFAEQEVGGEVTSSGYAKVANRKGLSSKGWNRMKDDIYTEKHKKSPRSIRVSSRTESSTSEAKYSHKFKDTVKSARPSNRAKAEDVDNFEIEKNNKKSHRSTWTSSKTDNSTSETRHSSRKRKETIESARESNRTKAKDVDGMDFGGTGSSKKHAKSTSDSSKRLDLNQKKFPDVSPSKSAKKKVQGKRGLDDDSEVLDEQPKKSKRVIRIDPHDISNKRLDDGIVIYESAKEKKKDLEKQTEISKNAQFRAIQPSPSILSFVEDNIFRNKLTFFAAAKASSSFPPPDLPEIAFAGRSNVGKSSLLNALTRQWGVARTSDKPGLTQTINFFNLGPKHCLVDLPGYGFAYAKEEVKDAWEELVKEYVSTRVALKRVCLLIDTKWGMKPRDHELIDLMERSQTKYQIVLTKTDMVFPIDLARRAMLIEENLKRNKSLVQPVMMVSSKSGAGIRSLRAALSKIARFAKI
ncbi:hypothetical protein FH972_011809 [Carpinus fangiana]|uniref:EngB-type G domain-containing protein n=1 Tax=Carpinus fangiana TaxID=176857 RepID=A0A660KSM3_9ROSI|nr:hypothetical protein FH972_011809 [Carpinus fangiana]